MLKFCHEMQSPKPSSPTPITFRQAFPPGTIGLMVLQIAVIVGGLVVGAAYLGKFLDVRFDTKPWLTLGLFLHRLVYCCAGDLSIGHADDCQSPAHGAAERDFTPSGKFACWCARRKHPAR